MPVSNSFRVFEERIARDADPLALGPAFLELVDSVIGVRLLTLTAFNLQEGYVRRVYSSNEDAYPLLGTKPVAADDWLESMQSRREIAVINSREGMEGNFPDLQLIRSLGCNASLSIPAMIGGELIGSVNALAEEGQYTEQKAADAAALTMPALICFLRLRSVFKI